MKNLACDSDKFRTERIGKLLLAKPMETNIILDEYTSHKNYLILVKVDKRYTIAIIYLKKVLRYSIGATCWFI